MFSGVDRRLPPLRRPRNLLGSSINYKGRSMDRTEFEAALARDGYEAVARSMQPNTVNPDHTHDFDARVMVLEGAITIGRSSGSHTYGPGEWCEVAAGELHSEQVGPLGVSYVAGRRNGAA